MDSSTGWNSRTSSRAGAGQLLLVATSGLAFLAFLNATILNVAVPDLARTFDADVDLASWTVTAYVTVLAASLIAAGRLADSTGRRRILMLGGALFAAASAGGALAGSMLLLVAARSVQGAAAAMITPASFGLLLEAIPADRRTRAIGVWSSAAATSAFVGPPLGGLMVDLVSWRAPLALSAAGAFVLVGFVLRLPGSREPNHPMPGMRGGILGGAAVAILALTTTQAQEWGWTDPRTAVGLAAGASGIAIGVLGLGGASWRAVDPALLRRKVFAAANALSIAFGFAAFSWLLAGPLFVATVWRWDTLAAALSVAPGAAVAALAAWGAGRLPSRGHAWAVVGGGVMLATTALALVATLGQSPRFLALWLPAGILAGVTIGGVLASLSAVVAASIPEEHFAQGAGVNITARLFGGTLGVAVIAALVGGGGSDPSRFTAAWIVIAMASAITAAGAIALLRGGARHRSGDSRVPRRVADYSSGQLEA